MYKKYEMELAGRTLRVDVDRVAKQANGAVLMHYGDTTVLCTATASEKPRDGIDFFPLSVEYNERLYSVGKIPGGFNKREGKASENAILTDRVIDRPMRPLFPKDYRNDVTLENLVEEIVGDIHDEYEDQEEEEIREILPEREYIALGSTRLDDLDELLHLDIESQDYDSIGGYIIEQLDRFPEKGESVTTESGVRLVVDQVDRTRIEQVHIYLPPKEETEEKEATN